MNTPFRPGIRVPFPHPAESTIDRQVATDLVSLLRDDGLIRGPAVLTERAKVIVTLDVEKGTEPSQFCEAIKGAHPELAERIVLIIQNLIAKDSRGQLVLQFPFSLRLAAIQFRTFANTGSTLLKLI
jgi:hypothetical protein